jgi:hypothetical protein
VSSKEGNLNGGSDNSASPRLAPGGAVAGGRYRLVAAHGGGNGLRYWQARDQRLGREVALVFVDPAPSDSAEEGKKTTAEVLDATLALSELWAPGVAGVLDVIRGKVGGIIVAEWTPGKSFAAAAAEKRLASGAAEALRPLADSASRAHAEQRDVGLVSPDQLRVTDDGLAILAFPGVTPAASMEDDVKALGAVLYAAQTGTWPLDLPSGSDVVDVTDTRLPAAERDSSGTPVDPQKSGAPVGQATLAMRTLDGSSVSSASTVLSLLDGAGPSSTPSSVRTSPSRSDYAEAEALSEGDGPWDSESEELSPAEQRVRDQRRWVIMAGTGAAGVLIIIVLLITMMGGFGGRDDDVPLSAQLDAMQEEQRASREAAEQSAQSGQEESADSTTSASPTSSARAEKGEKLTVSDATTWQPSSSAGNAENSALAVNVTDGSADTTWRTDTYENQFGKGPSAFKPGLGLLLSLEEAARLTEVTVSSPDRGVEFEVRTSDTASPTSLDDTTLVGEGAVSAGKESVSIDSDDMDTDAQYVIIWITKLSGSDASGYSAQIGEVDLAGLPED